MIYVLINGNRMKFLASYLNAMEITGDSIFEENDVIILPLRWEKQIKQNLYLLKNLTLFVPYSNQCLSEYNKVFAYMEDETLLIENAKLTALGMIQILSEITSLYEIKVDVIGQGRCAKALIVLFDYLNIKYRILYYKQKENTVLIEDHLQLSNILINTADVFAFENKDIDFTNVEYMIDLSSYKPFIVLEKEYPTKIIYPGPLPELYFARSSAQLIETFIRRNLNEN